MSGPAQERARDAEGLAIALLDEFADATGLTSTRPPRRYLWTDAFAVCGFLGLHDRTGEARFRDLGLRLVEQVHHTLGRHRADDPRDGWISGLDERAGAEHPTAGGLRIGKPAPERPRGAPYRPEEEWDRDGQYYHYLTRWMHALNRVWRVTREARFHRWAVELARAAHHGFVAGDRMYWKMSVDLSRPLVPAMGQHDPLDGRIVLETLRATAPPDEEAGALLDAEARALDHLCRGRTWITRDALGIGGLLTDCLRLVQLPALGRRLDEAIQAQVFRDADRGLDLYALGHRDEPPAEYRLAFRELGLAIGLHALDRLEDAARAGTATGELTPAIRSMAGHRQLAERIEAFWARPASRRATTWVDHADINAVMLAVSLVPRGYLDL